jgi:two-component system, LuxR family, response regulator FixJ
MLETACVHVVDDDDAVRDSLVFLLETAGLTVCAYASAVALLAAVEGARGGCIVTDVRMPEMDGLTLQRQLAARGSKLPVIVITGHGDVPIAVAAMKSGAADFLEKPFDDERLLRSVRAALATSAQQQDASPEISGMATRLASLTPREREVFNRLVAGQPNKTIAYDLGSSPRTVEVQRARVMEKMDARSLAELVRMAVALERGGFITP